MGYAKKFNEREKAVEWFATPSDEREPKEQQQLEKKLGISLSMTSKWLHEKEFVEAIQERIRENAKVSHEADIAKSTIKEAKVGNQQAVTNYYKYVAQIAEKSEHKIVGKVSDILDKE